MIVLMMTGCATAPERPEWPENMPPRAYYESQYAADSNNQQHQSEREYLLWVKRFYTGWSGVDGWHSLREQILSDVAVDKRPAMRDQLRTLGRRMAAEWAKASGQRAITGQTVQVWSHAAREAGARGNYEQLVRQIAGDLDALLAGTLEASAITLNRYYPDAEPPPAIGAVEDNPDQ